MPRITIAATSPHSTSYDVVVEPGALDRLPELLAGVVHAYRLVVIADETVARLHGARVLDPLESTGMRVDLLTTPAGEAHKTRARWAELTDEMLELGVGRDAAVLALGGGVTGDLAGFVAATYMRGLPVVQLPTSLLAMLDASVGGKTGVDSPHGKNLIGAFHQPRLVVIDPAVVATLPEGEVRAGLAEAVKHGVIEDASYFEWIEANARPLLAGDAGALTQLVSRSVEIKAAYVRRDPLESGARAALNVGHTIGHAIEALSDYTIPHGYAVSIGMVAEARAGEAAGVTEAGTAEALRRVLRRLGLPTRVPEGVEPGAVLEATQLDKKARADQARYALPARVGRIAGSDDDGWTHLLEDRHLLGALAAD